MIIDCTHRLEPAGEGWQDAAHPVGVVACHDVVVRLVDQVEVEGDVVDTSQCEPRDLLRLKEVVEVGAGVAVVSRCGALGVYRLVTVAPLGIVYVDGALPGEELTIAGVACGHDAVKHVDSTCDAL